MIRVLSSILKPVIYRHLSRLSKFYTDIYWSCCCKKSTRKRIYLYYICLAWVTYRNPFYIIHLTSVTYSAAAGPPIPRPTPTKKRPAIMNWRFEANALSNPFPWLVSCKPRYIYIYITHVHGKYHPYIIIHAHGITILIYNTCTWNCHPHM